jgi:hypothetical protein
MNVENTQSQMRKGILEYCILGILNKGEAYPSEILEKLRGAQMLVVEGTVYPLLTRLIVGKNQRRVRRVNITVLPQKALNFILTSRILGKNYIRRSLYLLKLSNHE